MRKLRKREKGEEWRGREGRRGMESERVSRKESEREEWRGREGVERRVRERG